MLDAIVNEAFNFVNWGPLFAWFFRFGSSFIELLLILLLALLGHGLRVRLLFGFRLIALILSFFLLFGFFLLCFITRFVYLREVLLHMLHE